MANDESVSGDEEEDSLDAGVRRSGALPRHVRAFDAATAVLGTLATRLSRGEVGKLAAALPDRIGTVLRYCPRPDRDEGEAFDKDAFVQRVAERLSIEPAAAEKLTRAVFAALHAQLAEREAHDAASQLPKELRDLWLGGETLAPSVPLPPQRHVVPPGFVDDRPREDELDLVGRRFLAEIEEDGSVPDDKTALDVSTAVLGALARRVSGGEARAFIAALPPILQRQLAPAASHGERPVERFNYAGLRDEVAAQLAVWPEQADHLIQLVFDVARAHVRPTEIEHIASQLPEDLKRLWRGRPQ
jgi:uncharacterized protein (DUF2267 family)